MEIFIFWFLFSIAVGILGSNRGRSGIGWFLISVIVSPLLGLIFLLVMRNLTDDSERPNPDTHVRCPECKELVRMVASKCKHCGVSLVPLK